ncbi:hypothetical protein DPMN_175701 [Dreissena polymorpha]|uniref:Uncharacterized protein n=2 Tax=Dreissena polymorpha TaxID=45954 RepID=A0A9D4IJ06_DREPO|nr:hypothetical protein DPMN_175701 [Dreissena polymorpha]
MIHYIQGQSPEPKIREYFYYIDHQGQLFLDDAKMKNFTSCFKEKKFLDFFFKQIKHNETGRYAEEFPYLSPCGRERNYIRCDDRPIVYVHLTENSPSTSEDILSYGYAGSPTLRVPFQPEKICMLPSTGRIYHPGIERLGGVGLIKSSIAIAISKHFEFKNGEEFPPTHFTWKGVKYTLTNELLSRMTPDSDGCSNL